MAIGYFDREGTRISKEQWTALSDDKSYKVVREYDNGQVYLAVEWVGKQIDVENYFPGDYELFVMSCRNYTADGDMRPDPVMNGKTFGSEKAAIFAYEEFLLRWSESHLDEEGAFIEADNDLTPPPPPNPDAPTSEVAVIKGMEDDGVGAW